MRNITIVVVLACAVWAVRAARRPPPAYTMIEGRVYEALDPVRGPMRPIAGAAVSNNWDDATTKTDADGRFALRVRRVAADEFLSLRAQIGDKAACRRLAGAARATGSICSPMAGLSDRTRARIRGRSVNSDD